MFTDLTDLANILDEHISKGLAKEKHSKIEILEDCISKGLSFDPFNPQTMQPDDDTYYNPYRVAAEGGFLPFRAEHWEGMGKDKTAYLTTTNLYSQFESQEDRMSRVAQAQQKLFSFAKSLDSDLIKAGVVPIGTVHTYSDGQRYVKVSEGRWNPVAASASSRMGKYLKHPNKEWQDKAHKNIDEHADRVAEIKDAMSRRVQTDFHGESHEKTKEAIGSLKNAFKRFYENGEVPDEVNSHFDKLLAGMDQAKKMADTAIKDQKNPKPEEKNEAKHHVVIHFKHNGEDYSHRFENVKAGNHGDAVHKITKLLDQKLKGAQIQRIHAETAPEQEAKA
jgi:hypothetical protein